MIGVASDPTLHHVSDMDMNVHQDEDSLTQSLRDMVARHTLPEAVSGYDVAFEDTWYGDPGVRISLFVPATRRLSDAEARQYADLMMTLADDARALVPHHSPYVEFRAAAAE